MLLVGELARTRDALAPGLEPQEAARLDERDPVPPDDGAAHPGGARRTGLVAPPRLVRDLSETTGKRVRLLTEGQGTPGSTGRCSRRSRRRSPTSCATPSTTASNAPRTVGPWASPSRPTLTVRARAEQDEVVLEVEDDGAGIDVAAVARTAVARGVVSAAEVAAMDTEEVLALVLRSGLSTATTVTTVSGRGYGLDVVHTDVARVGGQVEIVNRPGLGCLVRLACRTRTGRPVRILVADDSRVMRQIVIRTLRRAGYADHTFLEAADGASALELARTESPDLVLSDWNMPAPDGLEVLRRLRASGDPVPFGFVTSESSVEMRRRAHAAGAQFVIGKPFDADSFRDALAPVLPAEDPAPAATALPTTKAVRDLFERLLGRDVTVEPGPPVAVGADDLAYVALYVEDRLRLAATAVTDLALAVRCAAALGLAPRTVSDAALRDRQLPRPCDGRRRGAQRRVDPVQPAGRAARPPGRTHAPAGGSPPTSTRSCTRWGGAWTWSSTSPGTAPADSAWSSLPDPLLACRDARRPAGRGADRRPGGRRHRRRGLRRPWPALRGGPGPGHDRPWPVALDVRHIGSTSVPGLAAKPVVDVLLTVPDVADEPSYLPALEALGLVLRVREPGHGMLRTRPGTSHLHVLAPDDPAVTDYLDLRDWLRRSPGTARCTPRPNGRWRSGRGRT